MSAAAIDAFLAESRRRVDAHLDALLPPGDAPPATLHEAMRYAVFSGGKRLRPALAFAAAIACKAEPERALPVAGAVELIHAYSLVHDDLPALDDDAERRGRPSVHVRFGQATAILVGDALQAEAFACLAEGGAPADLMARFARGVGSRALVGGQVDDLAFAAEGATPETVESIHARKTATLFELSAWGAGRLAGASEEELEALARCGRCCGLAFQLVDDVLDADPSECSALAVLSPERAAERAREGAAAAVAALTPFGDRAQLLRALAERLVGRLP